MGEMTIQSIQADVERFMKAIGQEVPSYPQEVDDATIDLRIELMNEELTETFNALDELAVPNDASLASRLAAVADGIADLIYVAAGTASALGIDLEPVWEEVQRSNMEKVGAGKREDGKQLKPADWKPPQIEQIILEQIAEHEFADRSIKG